MGVLRFTSVETLQTNAVFPINSSLNASVIMSVIVFLWKSKQEVYIFQKASHFKKVLFVFFCLRSI